MRATSASSYARANVGLRGEVTIRPAPQGPGRDGAEPLLATPRRPRPTLALLAALGATP